MTTHIFLQLRRSYRIAPPAASVLLAVTLGACSSATPTQQDPDPTPTVGTLSIEIGTTGLDVSKFYTFTMNGGLFPVSVDDTVSFSDLQPGSYDLALRGQDYNCRVDGASEVTVTVVAGAMTSTRFDVECASKSLVIISGAAGSFDLYAATVRGDSLLLLESLPQSKEDEPAFSPDGRLVAFASDVGGDFDIYTTDGTTGGMRNLTQNPAATEGQPSWSPSGTEIVYRSYMNGNEDIWVMDADGGNQRLIIGGPARELLPQWSPDGTSIAYVSDDDGNDDIWSYSLASDTYTKLTSDTASDTWPSWSPNGEYIAFATSRDGDSDIYVMRADGSEERSVIRMPGTNEWLPAWSPDGRYLTFNTDRNGNLDIYWMRTDGTEVKQITTSPAHDFFATWLPNPFGN